MRLYDDQSSGTVARARDLRRNATEAEKSLLRAVKEAFPALKWRRQVPVGPYYADILCFAAKLVIEVDGGQHDEAASYGARRTRFIESEGYKLLRFWNNDALGNTEGVIQAIAATLSLSHREREGARTAQPGGKGEGDGRPAKEKGEPAFTNSPSPFRAFGTPSLSRWERDK